MSFAENLKQSRTEKHLTQERLAELLDVTRQAVSLVANYNELKYINGNNKLEFV